MVLPLARRRRPWLVVALPVAGWLVVRLAGLVRSRRAHHAGSGGRTASDGGAAHPASFTPAEALDHRPASSPHAEEIAAHNRRVIEEYRGRHVAPGRDGAP